MFTNRFVAGIIAVLVILTVVSCASSSSDSRPIPIVPQLYPGVWVEVIAKGYHNPACGDLEIDDRPECDPWTPKMGKGQIEPYKGDEDDTLNLMWVVNGKFRVHVQYDPATGNIPGTGWYPREALRLTDPLPTPTPWPTDTPTPTPSPTPNPCKYTVRTGDTLISIAQRFDTTVDILLSKNGIRNANWIYAGQIINVCSK